MNTSTVIGMVNGDTLRTNEHLNHILRLVSDVSAYGNQPGTADMLDYVIIYTQNSIDAWIHNVLDIVPAHQRPTCHKLLQACILYYQFAEETINPEVTMATCTSMETTVKEGLKAMRCTASGWQDMTRGKN